MQKFTSRRFLITIAGMLLNVIPLLVPPGDENRQVALYAMLFVTVIASLSIIGLNVEDWTFAKKQFAGNEILQSFLDAMKPSEPAAPAEVKSPVSVAASPPPVVSGILPIFLLFGLAFLIMRIGL